jgi:hypothetical protein
MCFIKHPTHNAHLANIPISNVLVKGVCLTGATRMFNGSAMTIDNMDSTLRGWAKLDTAAGESAIQSNVTWDIANYTDATTIIKITIINSPVIGVY